MRLMQLIDRSKDDQLDDEQAEAALEDLDRFLQSESWLTTTTLPLAIMGSGNTDLPAKAEALFHSLKLDVGAVPSLLHDVCIL